MTKFNLTSKSLTAQRNEYMESLIDSMIDKVAADLTNGDTGREVGVYAVAKAIAAILPNQGKGHADDVREQVNAAVDERLEAMAETDSDETEESDAA